MENAAGAQRSTRRARTEPEVVQQVLRPRVQPAPGLVRGHVLELVAHLRDLRALERAAPGRGK